MKAAKPIDLGLKGLDELFMTEKERFENQLPKIYDIPLSEIDDFPEHPFQVRMDEDMDQLVESVKERGVITPAILRRKEDGRYEMVAGHRRKKACELAGLETIRAEVREMTHDEAIILMVDSNLQRSTILPSEKAYSYKMRLEAMKRQVGRPTANNDSPLGNNFGAATSSQELAEVVGESKNQIFRYVRLTFLAPRLMDLVDERKIAFRPAVELSYLSEKEQNDLCEIIAAQEATPSLAQAIKLKKYSKDGRLGEDVMASIMEEEKPNQREKISFRAERLREFFPSNLKASETEDYVVKALQFYKRHLDRQREQAR